MPRVFIDDEPDPSDRNHGRKRRRIRDKGKKASQTELNWAAKYDAKMSATIAPVTPSAEVVASSPPPPEAKPDEVGVAAAGESAPLPAPQVVEASAAKPMPVPALAPMSAPAAKPAAAPSSAAPKVASTAPAPVEAGGLAVASAEVQAARKASLLMVWGMAADAFEELQGKVETTMQGRAWALPRTFWREQWLPLAVEVSNRYLPDSVSGLLVEGVTVVVPPVSLVIAAKRLESAGYQLGVPGEPGRGSKPIAQKPAEKPAEREAPPPNGRPDSTANPPVKRGAETIDRQSVRSIFAKA